MPDFLTATQLAALLGLSAAATWGAADFAGGLATRRAAPSRVVSIAHGLSLVLLAVVAARYPCGLPTWAVVSALGSGIAGGIGLMLFYEALSLGVMGLSAAVGGVVTAVLPVAFALRTQGAPGAAQGAGFALAAAAILLIAYAPAPAGHATSRRALVFATLAGVGFGLQLLWLHTSAAAAHSTSLRPVVLALTLSRCGGFATAISAMAWARLRHRDRLLPEPTEPTAGARLPLFLVAATAGLLDTAGNALYMLASIRGRLDVAAVLSSLYPGGTILLAAVVLRERVTRVQAIGIGMALAAVALVAT